MSVERVMPEVCPVKTNVYVPGADGARNEPVEKLPPPSACAVATVAPLSDMFTVSSWPKLRPPKSISEPAVIKLLLASIVAMLVVVVAPVPPPVPPSNAATCASRIDTRAFSASIWLCKLVSVVVAVVVVPVLDADSVVKVMSVEVPARPAPIDHTWK